MNHIYVISDTHFGQHNILKYQENRSHYKDIDEHDRDLILRWNAVVKKNDTVLHLGDVSFQRDKIQILKEAKGYKKLILGNHDHFPLELYYEVFTKVFGLYEKKGLVFTHVPVHPDQLIHNGGRWKGNVHGHDHSRRIIGGFYYNANIDVHHTLAPMRLDHLVK